MGCNLFTFAKPHSLRSPTQIRVCCGKLQGERISRAAILSYDKSSNENYISHRLVSNVLREDTQPFDKDATIRIRTQMHSEEAEGYVDLYWYLEHDPEHQHNTRFLVTKTDDPPYDAVLGKADARRYGLATRQGRR
ncbi:hypothetical protein PtrSN002B_009507 [Pyrenophora tritici-repentis]|uniref:Uncharacterized protein n=2 Tax=Pyrenophora tritici-repentis TaxID=45151 RepID=A0A2W1G8U4_9PLEO|nr:uncharacterized protein PTRG_05842 [Pyrenophora tritici-repentis Pt-1C-BFP]KAA8618941.1 hypothetical protein PtrV1_08370 [Pyrenophora tritici-repentis]EDU48762.1 hypothetical protein PTRG_05842 [Pyrenophora tritici-repentis Pt-1C-BFP]KAF7449405.1 hypothetical protein A1F99_064540 [Pyrenophora tritici-repentis]KAF7570570.1 hypothetical protein PtrM4_105720 [Pyrenophora tritici-repentis]KAG9383652.1 hypothetical protein A1F94_005563 [Pyrenophora tritici-repentis]